MIALLIVSVVVALLAELIAYRERYIYKYQQLKVKDWTYLLIGERGNKQVIGFEDVRK